MSELEKGAVKAVQDLYDVVHHDILSMDLRKNYETWELLSNARTEGRVFAKLKWPKDRVVIKDMQGAQVKNCIHCVDALLNERPKRKDRFNLKQRKYQTQLLLQRLQPEMYKIPQAFLKPYLWLQNRIIRRNRDPQGHWWTTNCLVGFIRHIASLAYHCHEPHDQVDHDCQEAHD
ncbi:callose synthase 10-like isoform X2 [Malus sylvestris]|uniref:callose synthase 10-like isoform X1 n=2 Tax=Malus TaxID=3749 RepID=UPI0010AB0ECD|nr:callose synthase 10-like isoform X2 [Malus domestica]XP_050109195.1 callose synthase 10-like isoform X2 [Malus sylvestris]